MNINLAAALEKLPALREVPSAAQVLKSPVPFSWEGVMKDGHWKLIKSGVNEFSAHVEMDN